MMKSAVIITILLLSSFVASAETVYTVDCNGGGDFRTIQACFDALPSKPAEWRTVRIMPGVYREKVTLDVYKDKVRILGDEMAETRIVWGDYAGKVVDGRELTTYDSYTMSVQADDVYLDCLTVENDAGRVGQAVALETRGDRIHLYHWCAHRRSGHLLCSRLRFARTCRELLYRGNHRLHFRPFDRAVRVFDDPLQGRQFHHGRFDHRAQRIRIRLLLLPCDGGRRGDAGLPRASVEIDGPHRVAGVRISRGDPSRGVARLAVVRVLCDLVVDGFQPAGHKELDHSAQEHVEREGQP